MAIDVRAICVAECRKLRCENCGAPIFDEHNHAAFAVDYVLKAARDAGDPPPAYADVGNIVVYAADNHTGREGLCQRCASALA